MSSKKPVLMIIIIFILPIICAALFYSHVNPKNLKTSNVGIFLDPPIKRSEWVDDPAERSHRWQLVLIYPDHCEAECADQLARLISIHQALKKDIPRIEVALWTKEDVQLVLFPQVKIEHLHSGQNPIFVIVDPVGNIVLKYDLSIDTSGILRDLKHLLKVSQIG